MDLKKYITNVENYPKDGIQFKDITTLMSDGKAYKYVIEQLKAYALKIGAEVIVGPEARGFIAGCPVATSLEIGFIPVRKPGKLPREVISVDYDLEYSTDTLCMHKGDLKPGTKVLIIDDLLATGGTINATIDLIKLSDAQVVGIGFIIELESLEGRKKISGNYDILSLVKY